MIRVKYQAFEDYRHLHINGHAGFDELGRDIVCAGVSAITYALMNYLDDCDPSGLYVSEAEGNVEIACGGEDIGIAFDVAMAGYRAIAQTYPDHVTVFMPDMPADSREKTAGKEHGEHAEE